MLPLQKGAHWVYEGTVKWTVAGSDQVNSRRLRWKMEVVDTATRGGYTLALIKGGPWDLAWYEPDVKPAEYLIVVRDRTTYLLKERARDLFGDVGTALDERDLADNIWFRTPIQKADKYCAPDQPAREDSMYCWFAEDTKTVRLQHVIGVKDGAYPATLLAFRTNPDHEFVELVPGIGITHWEYAHHGTVAEADLHLVEFSRGGEKAESPVHPRSSDK